MKRCAVVLGVAAACLLATSSVAFAADDPPGASDDQSGLVAVGDVSLLNGANICPNVALLVPIGNLLGILGGPSTASATTGNSTITCTSTVGGKHVGSNTGSADDAAGPAGPAVPAAVSGVPAVPAVAGLPGVPALPAAAAVPDLPVAAALPAVPAAPDLPAAPPVDAGVGAALGGG